MTKRLRMRTAGIISFLLLLALTGWMWSVWTRIYDEPPNADGYTRDESIIDIPGKNITNILLLGIDQRANEPSRTDSIIVLSINKDTSEVAMISIPRDSRVEVPGRKVDKINNIMVYGGVSLTKATVEKLLEVPIHHYVYTNFTGFEGIVDSLGGVSLDVEKSMRVIEPKEVALKKGYQKLNGEQALAYVRFRKDSEGDFGRMRRQQQFMKSFANELLQTKNMLKIPILFEQFARYVRTDMTITQLMTFAKTANEFELDEITALQIKGRARMIEGVSYVVLDEDHLKDTVKKYLRWEGY